MNIYNQFFGENPQASKLLKMLDLTRDDFPRYRDIYVTPDGRKIIVYTRAGGENRPYFRYSLSKLAKHGQIISAMDDEFDRSYHYIMFLTPSESIGRAKKLSGGKEPESIGQKFTRSQSEVAKLSKEELLAHPQFGPWFKYVEEAFKKPSPVVGIFDDDTPEALRHGY